MKIFTGTSWNQENIRKCKEYGIGMVSTPKDPVQPDKIDSEIPVIWDNGAFHGGSVNWKWDTMPYWRIKTKEIGLPLHAGRCNGLLEWDRAAFLGLDSVDGSTIIRHNMLDDVPRFFLHLTEQQRWMNVASSIDGMGLSL